MPEINFFKEDIEIDLRMLKGFRNWITNTAAHHNESIETINYIFCSDKLLHTMNVDYLNHDTYTDIITFDLREENQQTPIEADIFISIERVKENSKQLSTSFKQELARVMIHGLLHLIGFKDKTMQEKERMREMESEALEFLPGATVPRGTVQKSSAFGKV
ncbi:rRNA maturation RNase YbeY [Marivirga sp. S37H4]|uniref:Endoribonuclease YbeY n=1 Tax=Marivirga aurantiaca TaxID=2802615 RepID=A0A934X1E8_9BACT|nr:rRNA maturation RNase YbeY [Marivirga aurantiaca]MBK6267149.1 rRNA maturation RNase YbeY [Marivirga aurantiaca]